MTVPTSLPLDLSEDQLALLYERGIDDADIEILRAGKPIDHPLTPPPGTYAGESRSVRSVEDALGNLAEATLDHQTDEPNDLDRPSVVVHNAPMSDHRDGLEEEMVSMRSMMTEMISAVGALAKSVAERPVVVNLQPPRQRSKVTEYIMDDKGRIIGKREREEDGEDPSV